MKIFLFILVLLLASCKAERVELEKFELEFVVQISDTGIDTLATVDKKYSLRAIDDAFSFYLDNTLIRNFQSEREYDYGDEFLGHYILKRRRLSDIEGDIITVKIWNNQTPSAMVYADYLLIENYPFEGINCFKK